MCLLGLGVTCKKCCPYIEVLDDVYNIVTDMVNVVVIAKKIPSKGCGRIKYIQLVFLQNITKLIYIFEISKKILSGFQIKTEFKFFILTNSDVLSIYL